MSSNLNDQEHQNFKDNIKQEPEEEFLCILPSYDSENTQKNLIHVKQEKEIQSKEILKLQCKTCRKIFGSYHYLRKHVKNHQKQQCKICNNKVLPHSFEKHMKKHQNEKTKRKFECKICSYKCWTKWQLSQHALSHSKRFQCDLCGLYSASVKHNLMKHMTSHLVQGRYKCMFCRKLFDDRKSFRFHSRQVHGDSKNRNGLTIADLSCKTCGKEFDDVQHRKHHEKIHGEKLQCPICDKKCQPRCLDRHLKLHKLKNTVKKYMCDICGYKNAIKNSLKCHLEVHLNPDNGKCKICWKTFTNTNFLKTHSRTIHSFNVEPSDLCCNVCQAQFTTIATLAYHKLIHKVQKICPVCSKSVTPKYFSVHIKMHESKKEEKKFECKICKIKFHTEQYLKRHMKLHLKSLECDLCEYRTGLKNCMNDHMAKLTNHKTIK